MAEICRRIRASSAENLKFFSILNCCYFVDKNDDLLSIYPRNETGSRVDVKICWGSYWKYQNVTHTICCAHLLRELNKVIENHPEQTWAARFKKFLFNINRCMIKHLFPIRMRSATITAISLICSMMPSSKLHIRKIHCLKHLLKSAVARKRAQY